MHCSVDRFLLVVFAFALPFLSTDRTTGGAGAAWGQPVENRKYGQDDAFRQLEEWLPTPNGYRTASGQPGPDYWQQQVDYQIDVTLDDGNQRIIGSERIDYHNQSPESLRYLWIQLDQNLFKPTSVGNIADEAPAFGDRVSVRRLQLIQYLRHFEGGYNLTKVADGDGKPLRYTVVDTMMRVDLAEPLPPGGKAALQIDWNFKIVDADLLPARSGYEFFAKDGNYIYELAQWFPRLVAFTDNNGWQHKQFLGAGEFTLELGDYEVRITAPSDHVILATGTLQNPGEVLTQAQRERLQSAAKADLPVFIVTPDEAKANEQDKSSDTKTWVYQASQVRDFAWASSRKFIWDAQGHQMEDQHVMAMSLYPNEGEPLWSKYSTSSIIHTLNVYSRYTFNYPYPVAISVNGPVGGMEYPMICFNGPRPEEDGTYSAGTKYGLISVVIHEVGHNYFPMIVNSDERQWTWMDEGLNTFLQYLAEQEWEENYPSRRGEPDDIVPYMLSSDQVPIMTNSESLLQFGPNAYSKPATALNILRETILGRELFDFAFKEYARRWKFKRPQPADFFRTMEDASGVDLDWFWRGWFYSTDHVDLAIEGLTLHQIDIGDPDANAQRSRDEDAAKVPSLSDERNESLAKRVDRYPGLKDFYNSYDKLAVSDQDRNNFKQFLDRLTAEEQSLIRSQQNFYILKLKNVGGLVMPIPISIDYEDGTSETIVVPAEIWRLNSRQVAKLIVSDKTIKAVQLDRRKQIADSEESNNHFPPKIVTSRFSVFKDERQRGNPMRDAQNEATEKAQKAANEKAAAEKVEAEKAAAEKAAAEAAAVGGG
jgi:aminopeptidase N